MSHEVEVIRLLRDFIASPSMEIQLHHRLVADLHVDGDDYGMALVPRLERQFSIKPSRQEWSTVTTVNDILTIVRRHLEQRLVPDALAGIAGGVNLYKCAGNDPVNGRDPSGMGDSDGSCLMVLWIYIHRVNGVIVDAWLSWEPECDGGGGGPMDPGGDPAGPGGGSGPGGNSGASHSPNAPQTPTTPTTPCSSALAAARQDMAAVLRADDMWGTISIAAYAHGTDPRLLAAIGVRETGVRNIWQLGGGMGAGVFQIDLGAHPNVTAAQAFSAPFAANYAAGMLASNSARLGSEYPMLTSGQLTQATAASYNLGVGGISGNPATIDVGSTGDNYGSNVGGLMSCFF